MATQEPFMPLQVGKALSNVDLGIQGDDTGLNISHKNRSYCELTGMYWAWKNLKDVDIIGLCHYRRYFDFHHQCSRLKDSENIPTARFDQIDLSIPPRILRKIRDGVVVAATPKHYPCNLYTDYCHCHLSDDFRTLQEYFVECQSPEMQRAFYRVMYMSNRLRHYNMFLMTWHDFDRYCTWLFGILGEMERCIDITHYTPVQMRIFGYMAERLFNIYLRAMHFKVIGRRVLKIVDGAPKPHFPNALLYVYRYIMSGLSVWLANPIERKLKPVENSKYKPRIAEKP